MYPKHSKAKAQEIQGAILPIAEKYELEAPFLGAVLAGIFTAPSLAQLKSLNFNVVHLPYDSIVAAFASVEIDARFDEKTPDIEFRKCVTAIEGLTENHRTKVKLAILSSNKVEFERFFLKLRRKLDRTTERVIVLPLFGTALTFNSATEAAAFIQGFDPAKSTGEFRKYEVSILFSNSDEVRGMFADQEEVVRFLRYVTS